MRFFLLFFSIQAGILEINSGVKDRDLYVNRILAEIDYLYYERDIENSVKQEAFKNELNLLLDQLKEVKCYCRDECKYKNKIEKCILDYTNDLK